MEKQLKIINTLLLALVFSSLLFLYIKRGPEAVITVSAPSIGITFLLLLFSFAEFTLAARRRYQVSSAPGAMFMKMARFLYSPQTIEDIFEPTQRDFLDEYSDAVSDYLLADNLKAFGKAGVWVVQVRCKYFFAFLRTVIRQNFVTVFMRKVMQFIVGK